MIKSNPIEIVELNNNTNSSPIIIGLDEAKSFYKQKDYVFIDARDEDEFDFAHISDAINISTELTEDEDDSTLTFISELNPNINYIVYCGESECDLSEVLAELLLYDYHFSHIYIFKGGLEKWMDANFPTRSTQENYKLNTLSTKNFWGFGYISIILLILLYWLTPKTVDDVSEHIAVSLIFRVIVGIIFIFASIDKIQNPAIFSDIIDNYHATPVIFSNLIALIIPWIELIVGLCLIFGLFLAGSIFITSSLLAFFIIMLTQAILRGIDLHCGCFSLDGAPSNVDIKYELTKRIIEDIFLLLMMKNVWEKEVNMKVNK